MPDSVLNRRSEALSAWKLTMPPFVCVFLTTPRTPFCLSTTGAFRYARSCAGYTREGLSELPGYQVKGSKPSGSLSRDGLL
jgi:hypothetical protein